MPSSPVPLAARASRPSDLPPLAPASPAFGPTALWRRHFPVYWSKDSVSAEVRAKHIAAVLRLAPFSMSANLASGLLLCLAFWNGPMRATVLAWFGAMVLVCVWSLQRWQAQRAMGASMASPRTIGRVTFHAALISGAWAFLPLATFGRAQPDQQVLLVTVLAGMICAGGFVLATVAPAAVVHVLVLSGSTALALALTGHPVFVLTGLLVAVYAGIVIAGVIWTAKMATARIESEREAARQGQMVGLLLRDFEDQSADVLWEIDREGAFVHITHKLELLLGQSAARLHRQTLLGWFERHMPPDAADDGLEPLQRALREGKAFRDLVLPIRRDDQTRWWSLTARPLLDEGGHSIGWRGVISDATQAQQAQDRLNQLTHFDSLTGLANRVQLRERLHQAIEAGGGQVSRRGALLCADVDNFKWINDSYGHSVGDAVLQTIAHRLQTLVRHSDLVARLGGDEFAVLLDDVRNDSEVAALAQRVVEDMRRPCMVDGRRIATGVSVGVALIPDHGSTIDDLLGNADLALYAAKQGGRGRADFFIPSLGERNRRRMTIEEELRGAIERQELILHWQPQVRVSPWRIAGCEVLLRWQHPTLGAIAPSDFIAVAESSGLIGDIGAWVLAEACRQAARHLPGITVSVNVSTAQLARSGFVDMVRAALFNSGFAADRLEIEITESMFIDAAPMALLSLHELRQLGVRIALDDFGTGYSSLAYLRRFPFDTLKIDRTFVRELLTQRDARAIVGTVVDLARAMGMASVAEGVEEPAQLEVLREVGCDLVQGYLVAKPMPLDEFRMLVTNWVESPQLTPLTLDLPDAAPKPAPAPAAGETMH